MTVHVSVEKTVALITLDSPGNRNALSAEVRSGLKEALDQARSHAEARTVVLTHSGPVFCSGMDLKEPGGQGVREVPELIEAIWSSPKPVIARLAGPARAGGVGLMAACDIVIAAHNCTFAFSEVRLGLVPAVISAPVLRRISQRAANELFLTGETFDAEKARAIGLVDQAVPPEQLDAEVERYTVMLARGAPGALAATKSMLRSPRPASLGEDLRQMSELSAQHFAGEEGQEGLRAFGAKQTPKWVPEGADG